MPQIAVNRLINRGNLHANTSAFRPSAVPRLAWHPCCFCSAGCPPLLLLSKVFTAVRARSRQSDRFSDEPFRVRDVQFDRPAILVKSRALGEEIRYFCGTCRFGRAYSLPRVSAFE